MTTATCGAPVNVTQTSLRLTGNIQGVPLGGSVRFRYGTTLNGPYNTIVPAGPYANGGITADVTGLTAGTAYHFITEVLDSSNTVVATSTDCTASTLSATNGGCQNCMDDCNGRKLSPGAAQAVALFCDLSAGPNCPSPSWSIEIVCDASGKSMYAVLLFCNGAPQAGSVPSFFDFTGAAVTPVLPIGACTGADWEDEILCDRGNSNHQFIRRFSLDKDGNLIPELTGNFELDGTTAYTVVGPVGPCTAGDFEQNIFCDTSVDPPKPFISRVRFDENSDLIADQTGTFELDGVTPYVPVGPIAVCGGDVVDVEFTGPVCEKDATGAVVGHFWHRLFYRGQVQIATSLVGYKLTDPQTWVDPYTIGAGNTTGECVDRGSADIVDSCADAGRSSIAYGPDLLTNGDLAQSTGAGATSAPAVGWTTAYTPANNIYAAGAGTYALFGTNAGSVTGGNAVAAAVPALTGNSMAVNVGPNLAQPILSWANIFLENGKSYALEVDAAILNNPFGVSIAVDGVAVTPVTSPASVGVWQRTSTVFTFTGATGYHTVSLNSNNAAAAGNDHCFDNFSLRMAFPANTETLTPQAYNDIVKAVVDQVVKTTGCNDDRRDRLLAEISQLLANQNPSQIEVVCRCDDTDGDGVGEVSYKEIVSISPTGVVTVLANYNQSMSAAYTPVSPVGCSVPGDNLVRVIPKRKVLSGIGLWTLNADSVAPTVSVTVTVAAIGNPATPPTITDANGVSEMFQGESVTWSATYNRDVAGLKPPLIVTTHAGDKLSVNWTEEAI